IVGLAGPVSDAGSGVASAEFSPDGGKTWLPASISGAGWGFAWDTSDLKNGNHTLSVRVRDLAGNLGAPVQLAVILDNHAPFISLTESWAIWESGTLTIQSNVIPLQSVRVLLKDPVMRYPNEVLVNSVPNSTTASTAVVWDRVMGNYVAAPGSYLVEAEVCDIYDLCSNVTGMITIPDGIPTPVVATQQVQQVQEAAWVPQPPIVIPTSAPTEVPLPAPEVIVPVVEESPAPPPVADIPAWPVLTVAALLFMFAFLLMSDPRPVALRSLARTIKPFMKNQE
ncbi:MAG: Ig-like domain-containing protein, partial [Chloroflexota bacterium]